MKARLNFPVLKGCVCGLVLLGFGHAKILQNNIEIPLPTRLGVLRDGGSLSVSFDLTSLRKVKVSASQKMTLGLKHELRIYAEGGARPREAAVGYANINQPVTTADLSYLKSTQFFYPGQGGIPELGKRCFLEDDLSLFETDVPPQHMWNPQAGKTYTVLWKKVLKSVS